MHFSNLKWMYPVGVSYETVEIWFLIWPKKQKIFQGKTIAHTHTHTLLLLFSLPVVSDSLQPRGLQHARPPVLFDGREFAQTALHTDTWLHLNSTGMDTIPFIAEKKHRRGPRPIGRAAMEQLWMGAFMSMAYSILTCLINCTRWTEILSVSLTIEIVWCAVCSEKLGNLSQIEIDSLVISKEACDLATVLSGRKS